MIVEQESTLTSKLKNSKIYKELVARCSISTEYAEICASLTYQSPTVNK